MMNFYRSTLALLLFLYLGLFTAQAQCDASVPLYVIDLSANADTTWVLYEENALDRNGQCCSADPNENCIQFQITLNPNAAGIFFSYDGAGAFGSLNWQLDCGPEYNLNDTICVTDPGPFTLTFCKPGTDSGNYTLISVSKPTFPGDQNVPLNCAQPVEATGVTATSITWQSISPGNPGDYDTLLSCLDCLDPVYTPNPGAPVEVEYQVCGYPILDYCVGNFQFCDTVKFTTLDSIQLSISPANPTFCSGGDVTLTANATGGDGNYTYIWYDGSLNQIGTGSTYTANAAGSYTCEVRDGNYIPLYCDNFSHTVIVGETLPPVVDAGADQVLCADAPEATISGSVQYASGGIWSGGNGTYTPSNTSLNMTYTPTNAEIQAGLVTLTLTSTGAGSSCTNDSDAIQLFFVDTIQTNLNDTLIGCYGSSVYLNPSISGGLAPLTYSWTDGTTTSDNTLGEGTHCLTISDANGCQVTECLTITTAPELDITVTSTSATTNGGSDGTATAIPSGGTSPYNYLWSTSGTTQTETGLSYGVYSVTVTDNAGCTRTESVVVNEPRCDTLALATTSGNVLCNADSTGWAAVEATGGLAPYNYMWNDVSMQTTDTAFNLPAGVYEINVVDNDGCVAIATAVVTEPDALLNTMTHVDVTTQGGSDGSAQANVIGGFGSYYYSWSTTETTQSISGLISDWYTVEITDDNGCSLIDSVFINEPPCDQFQIYVATVSPLCNGYLTGESTLSIVNGIAPYSITWSTGDLDTMYVDSMGAGIYTVDVVDSQGCFTSLNFGISQPSPLSIGLAATPSTCNGSSNGTIDMTISGGTYPYYSFLWNSGQMTEDIINLDAGYYEVTITDTNGCQSTANTTLTDPDPLAVTLDSIDHVTCFGGTDGAIYISVSGGNMTYNYDWSNGATTQDLTGIDVGGYILNVTDGSFCSLENPITYLVNEPNLVEADTIIINCPSPGTTQTTVDITPIGGTGNYAVSSDGGSTYGAYGTYSLTLNTGQSYDIVVKDSNGCLSPTYPISIDPTLNIDSINFNLCYVPGQTNESIQVYVTGGTADYSISTDNGTSYNGSGQYTLSVPINASYDIIAQDLKGCTSDTFQISLPDVFTSTIAVTSGYNGYDISCFGFNDGEATVSPTGGSGAYTYTWSNAASTSVNSNLVEGTYTVLIEDGNNCSIQDTILLTNPPAITHSTSTSSYPSGDNISCFGLSDGSIDFTISGGTGIYTYDWDNDGTGDNNDPQDLSGITAGTYILAGTDQNGCVFNDTVVLTEPVAFSTSVLPATYPSGSNISCNGLNDGAIDYTVSGGAGSYLFDWDNDGTGDNNDTEDLSNIAAGTYIVVVTDLNNCTVADTVTLVEPTALAQSAVSLTYPSGDNISCFGLNDGSIDYTATGGSTPYVYNWTSTNGSGLVITDEDQSGLTAGTYMVTVTDTNNCSMDTTITLVEPVALSQSSAPFVYPSGDNVSCFGYNDGSIDYTISGGSTPYAFDWDNDGTGDNDDTEDLSNITAGTYIIIATDTNGCFVTDTITLTEPAGPTQSITTSIQPSGYGVSCYQYSDGWIDFEITGGAQPYTYDWDNDGTGDNDDTQDLSNLPAGTYNLIATDVNGCSVTQQVVLLEPDPLQLANTTTNPSCYLYINGDIDITVQGGTVPYTYGWSTGEITEDISGLGSGVYNVSITDSMGCTLDDSFTVTQPDSLYIVLTSPVNFHDHNIDLFGGNDGSIDATVYGGTTPYNYSWSNGETTEDIEYLTAGEYELYVIDDQGCEAVASIVLTEPLELDLPTAFSPNNDFANDTYEIHGIEAYPDNTFTVFNRWGNVIYETTGYDNTWGGETNAGEPVPDGVYFIILTINGGEIERSTYVHIKTH